ncbi:MAG: RNA methyltransferase [Hyphomonadaceae bacterium]|nr:RNA methyltransferase [Hyphomonadaceae bacterium]
MHAVLAALANPARRVERLVASRNGAQRLPSAVVPDLLEPAAIDALLPAGAVHQGVALRAEPLADVSLEEACLPPDGRPVLVLDGVTDPQNVGAVFRAAAGFSARAVVMQDRKSPPLTGALAKAAAGAIEMVPHVRAVNLARALEALAHGGYVTIGLEGEAALSLDDALADGRSPVIVLGAEGAGLRDLVARTCDLRARIPIDPRLESLNVAAAAAIALYAAAQRRKAA